jgi:hypothetical protein
MVPEWQQSIYQTKYQYRKKLSEFSKTAFESFILYTPMGRRGSYQTCSATYQTEDMNTLGKTTNDNIKKFVIKDHTGICIVQGAKGFIVAIICRSGV